MKCPTCLSTMKCITEIHNVPNQPGRQRMDLHCFNRVNDDGRKPNICKARCHMGVITEDPKEWICHQYSFDFKYKDKIYMLGSYDRAVDPYHQSFFRDPNEANTILFSYDDNRAIIELSYFIPISTGDNMHEEAEKLFHRLRNLIIYS